MNVPRPSGLGTRNRGTVINYALASRSEPWKLITRISRQLIPILRARDLLEENALPNRCVLLAHRAELLEIAERERNRWYQTRDKANVGPHWDFRLNHPSGKGSFRRRQPETGRGCPGLGLPSHRARQDIHTPHREAEIQS